LSFPFTRPVRASSRAEDGGDRARDEGRRHALSDDDNDNSADHHRSGRRGCGPPGRLADHPVARGGEALAREAELDVVLASLARVELSLGALPGYDAIIIVEPLDRLIGLS